MTEYVTTPKGARMWPFAARDAVPDQPEAAEHCIRLATHLEAALPGLNGILDRLLHMPGTERQARQLAEVARRWARRTPA